MKLCIALGLLALAAVGDNMAPPTPEDIFHDPQLLEDHEAQVLIGNPRQCGGNGRMVRQFNQRKEDTMMPCKYHAVRQRCGDYLVSITPGNMYLHPKYRLDSLWLGIRQTGGSSSWEGRTDNKIAVKYMNGWKNVLFNKKDGDLNTDDVLTFGRDSSSTWVEAKNGDFKVTFVPWDPDNDKFPMSSWNFECFSDQFLPTGYPPQICGGGEKQEVVDRMKQLGLEGREQVIYYDVFTNTKITQMNPKCANATRIMTKVCTEAQRRQAMITCSQVLSSYKHTKCVTKYSCDPMDVFLDCLDWVCSGFGDDFACERVGRGIDMCREFKGGDLTKKVKEASCFNDFLPILG